MKPEEQTCQEPALFRYTWPGRDESYVCLTHAQGLINIAQAMGFHLQLIILSNEEMLEKHCSQIVKKG
jgi:hypothetical protein